MKDELTRKDELRRQFVLTRSPHAAKAAAKCAAKGLLLYYETGTGKTLSAIHAIFVFIKRCITQKPLKTPRVFILTRANAVDSVWKKDMQTYIENSTLFARNKLAVFHELSKIVTYYTISNAGMDKVVKASGKMKTEKVLVIVDEVHRLLSPFSIKSMRSLMKSNSTVFAMFLTATPLLKRLSGLLYLCTYINPDLLEPSSLLGIEDIITKVKKTETKALEDEDDDDSVFQTGKHVAISQLENNILFKNKMQEDFPALVIKKKKKQEVIHFELTRVDDEKIYENFMKCIIPVELTEDSIRLHAQVKLGTDNAFFTKTRKICNADEKWATVWKKIKRTFKKVVTFEKEEIAAHTRNRGVLYSDRVDANAHGCIAFLSYLLTHLEGKISKNLKGVAVEVKGELKRLLKEGAEIVVKDRDIVYRFRLFRIPKDNTVKEDLDWHKWTAPNKEKECKILMLRPAAVESISLTGVTWFGFLNPLWNISEYIQAIGRARRKNSHKGGEVCPPPFVEIFTFFASIKRTYETLQTYNISNTAWTADEKINEIALLKLNKLMPLKKKLQEKGTELLNSKLEQLERLDK